MTSHHLVHRVLLLLQKCHYSLALIFILFCFCSSCLLLPLLILILYGYYLLWNQNKIESLYVGDQSLLPRLPSWSFALMMSVTPSTFPLEQRIYHELHVLPSYTQKGGV